MTATYLGGSGCHVSYSRNCEDVGNVNRRGVCPVCNIMVAVKDPDSGIFDGQSYHLHCLKKGNPEDEDVFVALQKYRNELKTLACKTADEDLQLQQLSAVLPKNGVCKK